MCFYGVQHAAVCIAIVRAVNNIQSCELRSQAWLHLYVSLFMRGLTCFRSCFILFSLFHYLYYTTRAHDMSNRTSSFEYYIFKYSLYFSKYLKRDWFSGFCQKIVPFLFYSGIFLFFAFFWKNSVFFCFTGEQVYIDI